MLSTSITAQTRIQQTVNPHLIIVGALLELSNVELETMIREELERNPALDAEPVQEHYEGNGAVPHTPWEIEAAELPLRPRAAVRSAVEPGEFDPFSQLSAGTTLQDYLRWQFRAAAPSSLHGVGEYLIENINSDGYLECDLSEVAQVLETPLEDVRKALQILQELDPPGIAARDLMECLMLQLHHLDPDFRPPDCVAEVIENLGAPGPASPVDIARRAGISPEQAREALEFIRAHLAPFPARSLRTPWGEPIGEAQPGILPDAVIALDGAQIIVRIPLSQAFHLRLNSAYRRLARAVETENAYARRRRRSREWSQAHRQAVECVIRARNLIQQIQQRHRTLWQVTNAVANWQKPFLLHGPDHLQPLTKKEIACALGIHESIVCRATRGKHVMLPSGEVVSFDVFFDDALPVKTRVRSLIAAENPARPLSDADIARNLAADGITIARRTVTKYRRAMRIPPARARLQWSAAGG